MRTKLICFGTILLLIIINNGYSDDYYYNRDTKIPLQRVQNKYYLQTYTNIDVSKLELVKEVFIEPKRITDLNSTDRFEQLEVIVAEEKLWALPTKDDFEKNEVTKRIKTLFDRTEARHEAAIEKQK